MSEVVKHKQKSEVGCVGDICYDKEAKKLRVSLDKDKCDPDKLDELRTALVDKDGETEVEWVIPAKTKKVTAKEVD